MRRRWALIGLGVLVASVFGVILSGPASGVVLDGYFTDDNNSIFEDDIDAIAEAGITRGCSTGASPRYCPSLFVTREEMAAFLRRSMSLPASSRDFFGDDNGSPFEEDINAIAEAGISLGCSAGEQPRYCPDALVTRGEMAAFLNRAMGPPATSTDYFTDDNGSAFEADINAIAQAGITRGCSGGTQPRYCPGGAVTRGAMAAFLRRGLGLPSAIIGIPMGDHPALTCGRDGRNCTLVVDVDAGRQYMIEEGFFQVLPATDEEEAVLTGSGTLFTLSVNGSGVGMLEPPLVEEEDKTFRHWRHTISFAAGSHRLVGRWHWDNELIQTTTVTVRASA